MLRVRWNCVGRKLTPGGTVRVFLFERYAVIHLPGVGDVPDVSQQQGRVHGAPCRGYKSSSSRGASDGVTSVTFTLRRSNLQRASRSELEPQSSSIATSAVTSAAIFSRAVGRRTEASLLQGRSDVSVGTPRLPARLFNRAARSRSMQLSRYVSACTRDVFDCHEGLVTSPDIAPHRY